MSNEKSGYPGCLGYIGDYTLSPIVMEVENYPKWKLILEGPIFHFHDYGIHGDQPRNSCLEQPWPFQEVSRRPFPKHEVYDLEM